MSPLGKYVPLVRSIEGYGKDMLVADLIAAVIVAIMLVPQSLAYAMLAGLPAEVGLYASILPLVAYALFGTSRTLSVGPVAVISLMTAASVGAISQSHGVSPILAAAALAFLSGMMMLALGILRGGFVANFLSHPVISGFISASAVMIAYGQIKHIIGVSPDLFDISSTISRINLPTLGIGLVSLILLIVARQFLKGWLKRLGMPNRMAEIASKAAPVVVVMVATAVTYAFGLNEKGVAIVGRVPVGLPALSLIQLDLDLMAGLLAPAALISLIGFVESVSVAQTLGAKRHEGISPDQELIGLGAANIAASMSGGYPVTGGFARSIVNFDAGARTQIASILTAGFITLATLFLTPALYYLPQATLAATIIVAVLSLIDLKLPLQVWGYSKADFMALAATVLATLAIGVEQGVLTGVALSLGHHLARTMRPHIATVGRVPGCEHFRNINRHEVVTVPEIITLRIDGSLYFANVRFMERIIKERLAMQPAAKHLILMMSAVNSIDTSALEVLEMLNHDLHERGIKLHLSEIKGPVMDKLDKTTFLTNLTGQVFLSQHVAFTALSSGA